MALHSIVQWNCNGFFAHLSELSLIINNQNPYIICIQETRFRENYIPTNKNFNIYFKNNHNELNASGGVAIFVNKLYKSEPIILNSLLQVVACTFYYPVKITICNIYLPPNVNYSKQDIVNIINQLPQPFILCGDFNCHNPLWGSMKLDRKGKVIESIVNDFGLNIMNSPHSPTHFSSYLGTFSNIDLTICSPSVQIYFKWKTCSDLHSSDHYPILLELCNGTMNERRPKWKLSEANWTDYQLAVDLDNLNTFPNCDDRNSFLVKSILDSASISVPKTSARPKHRPVPWFNNDIRDSIRKRRKALAIFKRSPANENLAIFRQERAKCRRLIIQSKAESWKSFTADLSLNSSSSDVWNKIRSISGNYTPSSITTLNCQLSLNSNVPILSNNKLDIIHELGSYFQHSFKSSLYDPSFIKPIFNTLLLANEHSCLDKYSYNLPFTIKELNISIHKSKGSSPGPDDVHYHMLKNLDEYQKHQLLEFYNFVWTSRTFPSDWKNSLLVPILKPRKDVHLSSSYRPICLSSTISKTMQRMVTDRLSWIIEKNGFLSNEQFGFRKQRSTTDCLAILETNILNSFASKQHLIAIFFDIEKAYDRTWRDGILNELYRFGIRGNMLHFIRNFLSNRTFQVILQNTKSALFHQETGVPQGEILSVYLFLIAINSVSNFIPQRVEFMLYADDLTIYVHSRSINLCKIRLQKTLNSLSKWCSISGFTFSTTKTKAIHFTRLRKHTLPIELTINTQHIEFVNSHVYLGMNFDRKLTWNTHITHLKTQTSKQLNSLKCLSNTKWGADKSTMIHIYKSFIQSRLDYGSTVYASASKTILEKLNTVLNLGARISLGAFRSSPVISVICEAGLTSLEYRRKQLICSQAVKILAKPNHPLFHMLDNINILNPRNTTCFVFRAKTIFDELNVNTDNIIESQLSYISPWTLPNIPVHTALTNIPRQDVTYRFRIQQEHRRLMNQNFSNFDVFFTDGSKTSEYTSSAFHHHRHNESKRLQSSVSINSAELQSIVMVLKHLASSPIRQPFVLICSDSLSSLQSISNISTQHPIVITIHEHLAALTNMCVQFMWIPGHMGIHGNEEADRLAKNAGSKEIDDFSTISADIFSSCKASLRSKWNEIWTTTPDTVKLRTIKHHTLPWPVFPAFNRRDSVVLSRIRIGHTHLTHGYLMSQDPQPICLICSTQISIKHIIEECTLYRSERAIHNIYTLKQCSGDNEKHNEQILQFLKRIQIYNRI